MSIKIQGSTIIDDSRNIVNAGITTTAILNVGVGGTIITTTDTGFVGIGTTNPLAKLDVRDGDVIVGVNTSNGVILTSPNGTKYRLIVDNVGVLSTVLVP
jgi:hypothetical protein